MITINLIFTIQILIDMDSRLLLLISILVLLTCKNKDDDGPASNYSIEDNLITLTLLDESLLECSGLVMVNDTLWTHNDSGNDPKIYSIPEDEASIDEKVNITNAALSDWEDIAQDDHYIYIGDFGNNSGERQDLTIYKVPKSNLPDDTEAEALYFLFSDQTNFNNANSMHNYDCEAMVTFGEDIFIFSKNHIDNKTKRYKLSKDPGVQVAQKIDEFDVDGLITGAGFDKTTNTLCLVGYNPNDTNFDPFVWIFYEFPDTDFFSGKSKRVNLAIQSQTEGICFKGDGKFLISSEHENDTKASLYLFDAEKWKE